VTNVRQRGFVVLVVLLTLMLAGSLPPVTASGAEAVDDTSNAEVDAVESDVGSLQQEDNETVRQRDPGEVGEDGDLAAVRRQLTGRMGEITIDCSWGIRIGNYDACDELDGEYNDALSKYVEVTGQEGDGGDGDGDGGGDGDGDGADTSFTDLQQEQREFANETREFRRTIREYREAQRNGNTTRARQLARELLQLQSDIQQTGRNLSETSESIRNQTGTSLVAIRQNTDAVTANVTERTEEVVTMTFVPTTITAARDGEGDSSARQPIVVRGEIETTEGTQIHRGEIVLVTGTDPGSRVIEGTATEITENGTYRLTYRPTNITPGPRTLLVRYRPPQTSVYLPANETFETDIEAIRITPSVGETVDSVSYGEAVATEVRLTVAGIDNGEIGLRGIPLAIRVDGQTLARGRTSATGTTTLQSGFPAGIPPGEHTLSIVGQSSDQAVLVEPVRRELRVDSTGTDLRLRATQTGDGERSVRVVGRLEAREEGVSGQELEVRIDGQLMATVETDVSGSYRGTISVPDDSSPATGSQTIGLSVEFDGAGTNLESTRASEQVTVQTGMGQSDEGASGVVPQVVSIAQSDPLLVGGGTVLALGLLGGGVYVVMRRRWDDTPSTAGPVGREPALTATDPSSSSTEDGDTGPAPGPDIETARDALEKGAYTPAVVTGYAAARRELSVPDSPEITPREFYDRANEADLSDDRLEALRELTTVFERVRFAGLRPDRSDARKALDCAQTVLSEERDERIE
jgi:hypothetical protein